MGCEKESKPYYDSELVRLKKTTYDKLKTLKEKDSFNTIIEKMYILYTNRIVTELELRHEIKLELTTILLGYLRKEQ